MSALLQPLGVEAVPVQDTADVAGDAQLAARGHTMQLVHAVCGPLDYERNGFRVYPNEWWHFDFQGWESWPILNAGFDDLSAP